MLKRVFITSVAFLILAPAVFAQTETPSASPTTVPSPASIQVGPKGTFKTQLDALKDQRQAIMADFKQKIQTIKDERKKMIVERIDDHIATANARLTTKMTNALNRLTAILAKLKEQASALKTAGKDTGPLDAAISAAESAIASAQTAVTAQAGKTYSTTISGDDTLKSVIGQMVSGFRLDIMATHKAVIDAREATVKVFAEIAKLRGSGDTNASNSAQPTNSQ